MTWPIEDKNPRTIRTQSCRKSMSSTIAVATCSPTTKARYGDARPMYNARNEGALGNRLRLQLVAVSIRAHPKLLLDVTDM